MKSKTLVILMTSAALIAPAIAGAESSKTKLLPIPKPGHIIAGTPAPVPKPQHLTNEKYDAPKAVENASTAVEVDNTLEEETIEERMARIMSETMVAAPKKSPVRNVEFGPPQPTEEQWSEMGPKLPQPLNLGDFNVDHFAEDKERLEKAFSAAGNREPSASQSRLDLSRFYLAHRMIPEGHSILQSLVPSKLDEQQLQDYKALSTAFGILDDRLRSESHFLIGSTENDPGWTDYPFWAALHYARVNDDQVEDHLEDAFEVSKGYPTGFLSSYLPELLEASLDARKWGLAKNMAVALEAIPGMKDSSTFQFLIGMAAEKTGRELEAFDAYRKATMEDDLYAQRARVAIVDLSVGTQAMNLEDARKFLEAHRRTWRGDEYEIEILKRLAVVTHKLGDIPSSLSALGDIIAGYPTTDIAKESQDKAKGLIEKLYDQGKKGDMSLSEFTRAHQEIARQYHYFEGFSDHHADYAQHLMDLGATAAAANEFSEAADYLEVITELELFDDVQKEGADLLRLKQAEALFKGGQFKEAAQVTRDLGEFSDPNINEAKAHLVAKIHANLENPDEVIKSVVRDRTPEYIRLLAEAYWMQGNWGEAKNHYLELYENHPDAFGRKEAISLLLAAYRDVDRDTAISVADMLPSIVEEPEWQMIAKEINRLPSALLPLSEKSIEDRVTQASDAVDLLNKARNQE